MDECPMEVRGDSGPVGVTGAWDNGVMAEGGDSPIRQKKKADSAAAPHVAFPAEQLAAARYFGITKDYLRAGEGKHGGREASCYC